MKKQTQWHWRRRIGWKRVGGWAVAGSLLATGLPPATAAEGDEAPADEATPEENAAEAEEAAEEADTAEEPLEYYNWVELSAGGTFVDGPASQFQRRYRLPGDSAFGGLNSLHWESFVGDNGFFKVDGRAIAEQGDYKVKLSYVVDEKGYLRGGYRQYRNWYDGVGGFDPSTGAWLPLRDRDLSLDRGEAWFEAGLTLPSWPEISLRYRHLFRDGQKNSLSWGTVNTVGTLRGIGATFLDIDEQRDIFEGKAKHTIGKTDLGIGLSYEMSKVDNSRNIREIPNASQQNYITQRDESDTDILNVHAYTQTRFTEKVSLGLAYAFTTLDADLGGSRIYGNDYDSIYDPALVRGPGYLGLSGGSKLDQNVVSANLHWRAAQHFSVIPSVRFEKQDLNNQSLFSPTSPASVSPPFDTQSVASERGFIDLSERLELRYSGVTNWLFYARGDWGQGDGDQQERQIALLTGTMNLARKTDFNRFSQKYTAGANWYPLRRLNLGAQYYHKTRDSEYDHRQDSTPNWTGFNRYPAFIQNQDFQTDDVNVRITWRPITALTLISRYDFQLSTIDTEDGLFSSLQTAETTSHIFSESISWSPLTRLYLQATLNYVLDETTTPANEFPAPSNLVLKSKNDYWNVTFSAGFALDQKTDLQVQYLHSRADDYVDSSPTSQPFGAGFKEHGITAALARRIGKGLIWTLKYGFFKNQDEATYGNTDYTAHLIYSSMVYRF